MEIKGAQELELLPLVVEYEVKRQLNLLEISKELKNKVKETEVKEEFFDVTDIFMKTECKVIRKALDANKKVIAVNLPKFKGFLKWELAPNLRLGTEMADRARFWGRVEGIFHTDELPGYGITIEEVEKLRKAAKAEENDAVVFVADSFDNSKDALKAVVERAREATREVPEETRAPNPDGTTRYSRPRPGAARMYPETDIPSMQILEEYIREIGSRLPELPEDKFKRLMKEYELNQKLVRQILDSEYVDLLEIIVKESNASPTTVAVFLTETLKALKRDGIEVDKVSENQMRDIFKSIGSGELMKEAVSDVVVWLSKNENKSVQQAIVGLGFKTMPDEELKALVERVIMENKRLVKEKGEASFSALMGIIMKNVHGRVSASRVSRVLKEMLKEISK
jgi:glutamyl-tRNA(Gln) amidotransferase subunit E